MLSANAETSRRNGIVRLQGIGARLEEHSSTEARVAGYIDAGGVLELTGMIANSAVQDTETDFVAPGGGRFAVMLIGRRPAGDEIVSAAAPGIAASATSTARIVSFTFGSWIYTVRIESREPVPQPAVQKTL